MQLPAPLIYSGKVRDTYDIGDGRLLMVASDRISAFDVVLPTEVPGKGEILSQMSRYWFAQSAEIIRNHLTGEKVADLRWPVTITELLESRSAIVREAVRVPVECVVRGYLAGSGWAEYQSNGSIAGHALPAGLLFGSQLPEPIFTPARKNDTGHDQNITVAQLRDEIGGDLADDLEQFSLSLYRHAAIHAHAQGILIADTKFEFGFVQDELTVIDELVTPDSSRLWDSATWQPGFDVDSLDKQYVRRWLIESGWNREAPGPELPAEIVQGIVRRYQEALQRLTGRSIAEWIGPGQLGYNA